MNLNKYFGLFLLIGIVCFAFQEEAWDDQPEIVQTEIQKRIAIHRLKKASACRKTAIRLAEIVVDSIIHEEVFLPLIDTLSSPSRPFKPEKQQPNKVDTNIILKPLFEK